VPGHLFVHAARREISALVAPHGISPITSITLSEICPHSSTPEWVTQPWTRDSFTARSLTFGYIAQFNGGGRVGPLGLNHLRMYDSGALTSLCARNAIPSKIFASGGLRCDPHFAVFHALIQQPANGALDYSHPALAFAFRHFPDAQSNPHTDSEAGSPHGVWLF